MIDTLNRTVKCDLIHDFERRGEVYLKDHLSTLSKNRRQRQELNLGNTSQRVVKVGMVLCYALKVI